MQMVLKLCSNADVLWQMRSSLWNTLAIDMKTLQHNRINDHCPTLYHLSLAILRITGCDWSTCLSAGHLFHNNWPAAQPIIPTFRLCQGIMPIMTLYLAIIIESFLSEANATVDYAERSKGIINCGIGHVSVFIFYNITCWKYQTIEKF